ncbi:MAG: hypothetical protein R2867_00240 [Caldilineaceae bacterium]
MIDHLQALPHDLIQTLLKSLRAIHTELPPTAPYKIMAVVAGGFDLLGFSYGSTSPFNIAKR